MRYVSTRTLGSLSGQVPAVPWLKLSDAIGASLAPDGGLYVPEKFPRHDPERFPADGTLPDIAEAWLRPFFEGDRLASELREICEATFAFPIPLAWLDEETALLELFHGPTAAFKDVGARFLAECLSRLPSARARTILVATSGDTGGAVAAAFHGRPGFEICILFPKGRVSPRQQKQLTAWGGNVRAFAVRGDFDDCQRMVKAAFADTDLRKRRELVSANSINLGRLLPQAVYYAAASLEVLRSRRRKASFLVPSGNLGNATAAVWAKQSGMPIDRIVLAHNANRAVADYFSTGEWKPLPTVTTLANAMDVGSPSNFERLRHLYPRLEQMKESLEAFSVDDERISAAIREGKRRWGVIFCPHTAAALAVRPDLSGSPWVIVATAHAAKFDTIVEPLVGSRVPVPPALEAILARPSASEELEPTLESLRQVL